MQTLLSGPASGVIGAVGVARPGRVCATSSPSTWAAPAPMSPSSPAARSSSAARLRSATSRSSCQWSASPASAPAAARSPGSMAPACSRSVPGAQGPIRARLLRARRRGSDPLRCLPPLRLPQPRPFRRQGASRRVSVRTGYGAGSRVVSGLAVAETASAIVRVALATMYTEFSAVLERRGIDPRDFTLVAFGGAGPVVACLLAEEVNIPRVLVPRAPGTLCALGALHAESRRFHPHRSLAARSVRRPCRCRARSTSSQDQAQEVAGAGSPRSRGDRVPLVGGYALRRASRTRSRRQSSWTGCRTDTGRSSGGCVPRGAPSECSTMPIPRRRWRWSISACGLSGHPSRTSRQLQHGRSPGWRW